MEKGLFFQDHTDDNHEIKNLEKLSVESEVDSNNFDAFDAEDDLFEEKKGP
jgi:hypothetical protein